MKSLSSGTMRDRLGIKVVVRGGGEMATGVVHRLVRSGFRVCITEIPTPLAIRREVAFCEAVFDGQKEVEGLIARRVGDEKEVRGAWDEGRIPLLVDPECQIRKVLKPQVLVDAIMAKRNTGTRMGYASLVIGLGPGFHAGKDVHWVVETNRGHNLGRVIEKGEAEPDSGIPGEIRGYTWERVLRAPASGRLLASKKIGDPVKKGEPVARVEGAVMEAGIDGVLRGILRDGFSVHQGMKVGDIDPRGTRAHCFTISDKARAVGGGVLEAILMGYGKI